MNIRLYHPDSILENNTSLLSKEHTHYVVNVMRLKRGSNLNFFNKNGEWKSEIIFLNKDRVEVRFLEKIKEAKNLSKTEIAISSGVLAPIFIPPGNLIFEISSLSIPCFSNWSNKLDAFFLLTIKDKNCGFDKIADLRASRSFSP